MDNHFVHNEYFGSAPHAKFCDCGKSRKKAIIMFWGAFVNRQFHRIKYFCNYCFEEKVKIHLLQKQKINNCVINIKGYRNEMLPTFLLDLRNLVSGINNPFLPI